MIRIARKVIGKRLVKQYEVFFTNHPELDRRFHTQDEALRYLHHVLRMFRKAKHN